MAKFMIKVEHSDIKTCKLGKNIMIQCENNIDLIFTPEAMKEIINDFDEFNKMKES